MDDRTVSRLRELPPSAKLVYKVLEEEGRLTQRGIAEESLLSPRTVRDALDRLDGAGLVDESVFIPDARKSVYTLRGTADAHDRGLFAERGFP